MASSSRSSGRVRAAGYQNARRGRRVHAPSQMLFKSVSVTLVQRLRGSRSHHVSVGSPWARADKS